MLDLPRTHASVTVSETVVHPRRRVAIRAGVVVPLLFIVFAAWGALMSYPAFQALLYGVSITDSIAALEHGKRTLRPVWTVALPGLSLAAIGIMGALWSHHQYRSPEPRDSDQ